MTAIQVILIAIAISLCFCDDDPLACGRVMNETDYKNMYLGTMKLLYVIANKDLITKKCVHFDFGKLIGPRYFHAIVHIYYKNLDYPDTMPIMISYEGLQWRLNLDNPSTETVGTSATKSKSGVITMTECLVTYKTVCKGLIDYVQCTEKVFLLGEKVKDCKDVKVPHCFQESGDSLLDYFVTCNIDNCNDTVKENAKTEAERVANLKHLNVYQIDQTDCPDLDLIN